MTEQEAAEATEPSEQALWRKAIADQVRRNCTPSSEAYSKGGDSLIYAVCDWIENPPDWSVFVPPATGAADRAPSVPPRFSILEHSSASREILKWHPARGDGPGWYEVVAKVTGYEWADAVSLLDVLNAKAVD